MSQIAGNGKMNYKPNIKIITNIETTYSNWSILFFLHYNINVFVWRKLNLCMLMHLKMTDGVKKRQLISLQVHLSQQQRKLESGAITVFHSVRRSYISHILTYVSGHHHILCIDIHYKNAQECILLHSVYLKIYENVYFEKAYLMELRMENVCVFVGAYLVVEGTQV